ncbi:MAG: hypothetical protein ACYTFK_14900, partial [Planctomycetota bacterium]
LYAALSPEHKQGWDDFSPTPQSLVATNFRSVRDKERAGKVLEVTLLGTDAKYRKFPYPLENLRGKLIFTGGDVEVVDVVSQVGDRRIRVNGETRMKDGKREYDVLVDAENIELDDVLLGALPEAQQRVYKQVKASGFVEGQVKIFTETEGDEQASFTADVRFKDARFEGDEFPFLITNVSGDAVFTKDSILLKGLQGTYNNGNVNLKGTVWPGDTLEDWGYNLELRAKEIELREEFTGSFPQKCRRGAGLCHRSGLFGKQC